jgi:lipoprotein
MKSTKLAVLLMSIAIAAIPPMFTSCSSGDEEEWNSPNDDWDNENNGNSDPTYELVKKNISASVSYGDYSWNISIKSKLSSALPGKYIVYGVESGYGDYQYYEHFKFNNSYTQKNDGNGNMTISYPTFVGNEYASEGLYWSSYKALKEKKDNGEKLNSDEQDLWNDIVKYMKAKESKAKSSFCGRLYAQFDNKRYVFYSFGQKPSSGSNNDDGNSNGGDTGGGSTGGSTSYEKPDIAFDDFTAYQTKLKVVYKIYNKNEAKVTSAKVYYGTSSNPTKYVSASVAGVLITANISGLKKGTTYYVKCVATGKGGTTTTGTTKVITNY